MSERYCDSKHINDPDTPDRRKVLLGGAALATVPLLAGIGALAAPEAVFGADHAAAVKKAITAAHAETIQRLREWIALPSIAAQSLNYPAGADYMAKLATDAGFQHVEVIPTSGKPGVFATLDAGAKKTLGVYFMYDVKQFDPAEWSSPPLEGRLVDRAGFGKMMIGRGADNQKGPETTFLAVLHAFKAAGVKPPVNLVLVAEGEEEVASPHFPELVTTPRVLAALQRSVGVMVPTPLQGADGFAALSLGAKGVLEFQLIVDGEKWGRGPKRDIHSSEKARVDSPSWHLVSALSTLVSPDGNTVEIDGLQAMIAPLTPRQAELIALNARGTSEEGVKRALGVDHWIDNMTWEQALLRLAQQPTVNIQGLVAGYTGDGGKTILPHRAVAKLDIRLVPNMTKEDTFAKLRAHLDKRGFQDVEIEIGGGYSPTETDENAGIIRAARAVFERAGVKYALYPRQAGSWPGVHFSGPPVSRPVVSFGLGHGGALHAPDEYFLVESSNPKIAGLDEAAIAYTDFLYQVAAIA